MTSRKPYRICNKANPHEGLSVQNPGTVTATLKELKDRYEIRVWIPGPGRQRYFISITEGILYVYRSNKTSSGKNELLACFILPANIQQNKVTAFYRKYGIKIIMPVASPNGMVISIPVLPER